jgi:hypothetical protein
VFPKRFLDMFQNRFSISFRRFGPSSIQISRLRATMPAIRWERGLKFGFDTIPISSAHRHPLRNIPEHRQDTAVRPDK